MDGDVRAIVGGGGGGRLNGRYHLDAGRHVSTVRALWPLFWRPGRCRLVVTFHLGVHRFVVGQGAVRKKTGPVREPISLWKRTGEFFGRTIRLPQAYKTRLRSRLDRVLHLEKRGDVGRNIKKKPLLIMVSHIPRTIGVFFLPDRIYINTIHQGPIQRRAEGAEASPTPNNFRKTTNCFLIRCICWYVGQIQ